MSYKEATRIYPNARREEYALLNLLKGQLIQYPYEDCTIALRLEQLNRQSGSATPTGLSFVNLHHCPLSLLIDFLHLSPYSRHYAIEVPQGSPVASFLDEYIGLFKPGGHRGLYLNNFGLSEICRRTNFKLKARSRHQYHWYIDRHCLKDYCNKLFSINLDRSKESATIPIGIEAAVEKYLNYDGTKFDWELEIIELATS